MPLVSLSIQEAQIAAMHGMQRRLKHCFKQTFHPNNPPAKSDRWSIDIEGSLAELAVCKHFGFYWTGLEEARAQDSGCFEVRTTVYQNGCLLLQPDDNDDDIYILVINDCPRFKLVGWIKAKDGKIDEHWKDKGTGRPCYYVPQSSLRPIDILEGELK